MSLGLRDRLRQRWNGIAPAPDPPRWIREEAWIPPQTGGGYEPDGAALVAANRRRRQFGPRPVMELASPEEMAAAGWRIDQSRIDGRLS